MILRFIDCGITKLEIRRLKNRWTGDVIAYYFPPETSEARWAYYLWKYVPFRHQRAKPCSKTLR